MSTESKRPAGFGPVAEYRAHFELWNEASAENGAVQAASDGRRSWTTPVLAIKPEAPMLDEREMPARRSWHRGYWLLAAAAMGALLLLIATRPWKSARVASTPIDTAVQPAMAPQASPEAMPSVVMSTVPAQAAPINSPAQPPTPLQASPGATPSVAVSTVPAQAAPFKQEETSLVVAVPQVQEESPSADDEEWQEEFQPAKKAALESSMRSELAHQGFSGIGVSVAGDGDVFLAGTFLSRADERRAIAMVRAYQGVHDIYVSGSVWSGDDNNDTQATAPSDLSASVATASPGIPHREPDRERGPGSSNAPPTPEQ